jgi:hypothetical protein
MTHTLIVTGYLKPGVAVAAPTVLVDDKVYFRPFDTVCPYGREDQTTGVYVATAASEERFERDSPSSEGYTRTDGSTAAFTRVN